MKILLVEDDPNKSGKIRHFIGDSIPGAELVCRPSYQSGLAAALGERFDLILLDMSLPTYDIHGADQGNRTRAFGGREILDALKRRGSRLRVAVVTQFETFGDGADAMTLGQLNEQLRREYPDNYVGTVFYQPSETTWQQEMARLLRQEVGKS